MFGPDLPYAGVPAGLFRGAHPDRSPARDALQERMGTSPPCYASAEYRVGESRGHSLLLEELMQSKFKLYLAIGILLSAFSGCGPPRPVTSRPATSSTTDTATPLSVTEAHAPPITSLKMIDAKDGWGIANQSLLRTDNGGKSWSNVTPTEMETVVSTIPTLAQGFNYYEFKAAFLDAKTAWIAAPGLDGITFFHTVDGGRTWQKTELVVSTPQQVYPIQIISFAFLNTQTGWLLRSTGMAAGQGFIELYQTQNSGATWHLIAEGNETASGDIGSITTSGQKTGVSFRDTANGWLTGYSAGSAIYVYRTKDAGLTWNFQELSIPNGYTAAGGSAQSYPATFFDDNKGVMPVYLGKTTPSINLFFYITADGGESWSATTPLSSPTNEFVWSWLDPSHGFAAENGTGILYSTSDGGKSWSKITLVGVKFSQLDFVSPMTGWGISEGSLVQTLDGGKTWHTIYP